MRRRLWTRARGISRPCLSGSADMQHNGGIRPREIAQDKVLICCSMPLSDLTIDA